MAISDIKNPWQRRAALVAFIIPLAALCCVHSVAKAFVYFCEDVTGRCTSRTHRMEGQTMTTYELFLITAPLLAWCGIMGGAFALDQWIENRGAK